MSSRSERININREIRRRSNSDSKKKNPGTLISECSGSSSGRTTYHRLIVYNGDLERGKLSVGHCEWLTVVWLLGEHDQSPQDLILSVWKKDPPGPRPSAYLKHRYAEIEPVWSAGGTLIVVLQHYITHIVCRRKYKSSGQQRRLRQQYQP
jgi:hypothetical protein